MNNLIKSVLMFFKQNRRGGTTSLLKKIAKENDVWVLVANEEQKKDFQGKAISLYEISKIDVQSAKPVLVDNKTMLTICEDFSKQKAELQDQIMKLENLVDHIHTQIDKFKRNY